MGAVTKKAPRVIQRGISVTQHYGTVVITLNGTEKESVIEALLQSIPKTNYVIYK